MNYYWRLFATGFCFLIFGIGGVILRFFVFPIMSCFPGGVIQKQRRARLCIHFSFFLFLELMRRTGVLTYDFDGLEKLNKSGQLIIANHPTLIDVILLVSRVPLANCIVKQELWNNPIMKGAVVNTGYISNGDSEKMINDCVSFLKSGGVMIIFPEGTRSVPGKEYLFTRGAARIALEANVSVTPVVIGCNPSTLTKAERWYQIPSSRAHLSMRVKDDIDISDFLKMEYRTIAVRRFNKYLVDFFSKQCGVDNQHGK